LIRLEAGVALRNIGAPAVPELVKRLRSENPDIASLAARILGEIASNAGDAIAALLAACENREPQVRASAITALGRIGVADEGVLKTLTHHLEDQDSAASVAALRSLGRLGAKAKAAAPIIARMLVGIPLEDLTLEILVVLPVLESVRGIGPEAAASATPAIVPLLQSKNAEMRRSAVDTLMVLKASGPEVIGKVEMLVQDKDDAVRQSALNFMSKAAKSAPAGGAEPEGRDKP